MEWLLHPKSAIQELTEMADQLGISYYDKPKVHQYHRHSNWTMQDVKKITSNRKKNKLAAKARRKNK